MMTTPENRQRVALVTGAARGIGLGIAQALRADGLRVAIVDLQEKVFETAKTLGDSKQALGIKGDISSESDVARIVREVVAWGGSVDVLVNNAGMIVWNGDKRFSTLETKLADWQRTLDVNLTGTFLMCRECVPLMKEKGWGRVINISSQAARTNSPFSGSAYTASKAGIIGFSRIFAGEVGGFGITINCVAPGRVRSEMNAAQGEDADRRYLTQIPVGRIGGPEDIGAAVAYLASDAASFVTGTIIDVNGGAYMV